jgi:3'-phosphoadenosine 5'-phosphosulfate sulfotransferase (PAPS reductase)/FAD synthetase
MEADTQNAGAFLRSYDHILIASSGGADSTALALLVLEAGIPPETIELHHHDIDGVEGGAPTVFDWEATPPYVRSLAQHLRIPLHLSWREGGLWRELHKVNAQSAAIAYLPPGGPLTRYVNPNAPRRTRPWFPQQSSSLTTRWCSSYGKVELLRRIVTHEPRFLNARTIVLTGERGEESPGRERYSPFQPFHGDKRSSPKLKRHVDHWRPLLSWTKMEVWAALQRWRIRPHPAYEMGFGRLSCRACIFSRPDSWATTQHFYPEIFAKIAEREATCGRTINRNMDLVTAAARGTPYQAALADPNLAAAAGNPAWKEPMTVPEWRLPAGAHGPNDGPS